MAAPTHPAAIPPRRARAVAVAVAALVAVVALVAACGGSSGAGASPGAGASAANPGGGYGGNGEVAPSPAATGTAALCSALTAADFAAAGVEGAGQPTANADPYGAYCVYAGTSGGSGGIELDVFPHADEASAHDTYATAAGEGPGGDAPPDSPFDEASFAVAGDVAYLVARDGTTVVALAVPKDVDVAKLVGLASLAAQRAADMGK